MANSYPFNSLSRRICTYFATQIYYLFINLKVCYMKNFTLIMVFMFLLASCATESKFPVSGVVPAATIKAKKKQDKNNNFIISVSAKDLASPSRLSPSKNVYVVWIDTKNGVKNIGQLANKNAGKSVLETLTVFEPEEIFITAEEQGNVSYPSGTEISRVSF